MSEPRSDWMSRNWKWFVPTGCLTLVLLVVLFVGAMAYFVLGMMKGSGAYAQALERARANPAVVEALGKPVEEGLFVSGSIHESGPGGSAELAIPLTGPKGKGTLYVDADKALGAWTLTALVLEAPDGSRIDLLAADAVDDVEAAPERESGPSPEDEEAMDVEVEVPAG